MDVKKMLKEAVLYYRHREANQPDRFLHKTRLKNVYVALDVLLANIANRIGWFAPQFSKSHRRIQLMDLYVKGLSYYFLLANLKNWNQIVLISDRELDRVSHLKSSKDMNQLYLAMKNMLYNSYFFRRQNDLMYSWKLYLKMGLADFDLSPDQVETAFNQQYHF